MKEKLAILGGIPVRSKPFQYEAAIGIEEKNAVSKLMETKALSGFYKSFEGGEKVIEFEKDWAKYFNVKNAIAVNSGTSALHIALAATGIGPGDEVIVTPYSFSATASSIVMNNAIPIFCDIDPVTFNIDVNKIEALITKKTKAILPVHLYGYPADIVKIMSIAKKYNLNVIEDTCQSPGTKVNNKLVGTYGDLGTFSTVETKNISTGEGGVIITDNDELALKCKLIRNHGEAYMVDKPRAYLSNMLGYNFRPTEFQAVLGIEQLKKLNKLNEERNYLANFLIEKLSDIKELVLPKGLNDENIIHHLLCIQYDEKKTQVTKAKYMEAMKCEGIELSNGYPRPLYMNKMFLEKIAFGNDGYPWVCSENGKKITYYEGMCPVAEEVCNKAIIITQIRYPNKLSDMEDIVNSFKKVSNSIKKLI
jgi:perosamine synthetase